MRSILLAQAGTQVAASQNDTALTTVGPFVLLFVVALIVGTLVAKKMRFKSPFKAGVVGAVVITLVSIAAVGGLSFFS